MEVSSPKGHKTGQCPWGKAGYQEGSEDCPQVAQVSLVATKPKEVMRF